MEILCVISLLILTIVIFMMGYCYSGETPEIAYNRGIEFAMEGKFKEAQRSYPKAMEENLILADIVFLTCG